MWCSCRCSVTTYYGSDRIQQVLTHRSVMEEAIDKLQDYEKISQQQIIIISCLL
jgi:SOS response regulatory protein OraA/RecX